MDPVDKFETFGKLAVCSW